MHRFISLRSVGISASGGIQGLRDLGYVDGRNIVLSIGGPAAERMRALAEELVWLKVDIIMAPSSI